MLVLILSLLGKLKIKEIFCYSIVNLFFWFECKILDVLKLWILNGSPPIEFPVVVSIPWYKLVKPNKGGPRPFLESSAIPNFFDTLLYI
jgi:hypothetical protein